MEPKEKAYLATLSPEELLKIIEAKSKEIRELKTEHKEFIEAIEKEEEKSE